jgi:hypothetical protein
MNNEIEAVATYHTRVEKQRWSRDCKINCVTVH